MNKKAQLDFDFEFNPVAFGLALIFWLLILIFIWKDPARMWKDTTFFMKMSTTLMSLPMFYIATKLVLDKYDG